MPAPGQFTPPPPDLEPHTSMLGTVDAYCPVAWADVVVTLVVVVVVVALVVVVTLVVVTGLVPLAQVESLPENCFRQVVASQCAASTSHQPYCEQQSVALAQTLLPYLGPQF